MTAAELARACQTVEADCDAVVAARLLSVSPEPYLVVVDSGGEPFALALAEEVLRRLVPDSLATHGGLVSLSGPFAQAHLAKSLGGRTVQDLLPEMPEPPCVAPDTLISQLYVRLTRSHSPAAVVVDRRDARPRVLGIVAVQRMLRRLLDQPAPDRHALHDSASAVLTASRLLVAVSAQSLASVEETLTMLQFRMMVLLRVDSDLTPSRAAALLGVDQRAAERMASALRTMGLLSHRHGGEDGESVLTLSHRGQDLVHDVTRRRMQAITRIVESMPVAERATLVNALRSFTRAGGEPSVELLATQPEP
ncbi:hypothetical protein H9Y04_38065 [Streptomyces sp. TRM66268-LWL]|uniref:CBS domain-containing protein n=1 Tax=Streptomyces polyasparticus TaxID=2767826 RepID=A0ABR7SUR6_9ACTN|nr:hypothetical protein [Streptomyces polyasparticus]MBC9718347.1 hypothetical protein [Streptomyces polyasparticus]